MNTNSPLEQASGDAAPQRCPRHGLDQVFDPFHDPYLSDPYAFWRRAHKEEPVFYSSQFDYWIVTRYSEIKAIFADPQIFSASNVQRPIKPLSPEVMRMLEEQGVFGARTTISSADPPTHTRLRKFEWEAFTPKRVAQLEPAIRRMVTQSIRSVEPLRRADLVEAMFYTLPVLVLLIFLGMPEEDVPKIKTWAKNRLMLTWGYLSPKDQMREAEGLIAYWNYSKNHVQALLSNPPDNFVGDLIRVRNGNDATLSVEEISGMVYGLLLAGHETTTSMASNSIVDLLTHRHAWESLCADPGMIPNAVEELLRFDTSVTMWRRKAMKNVEIGGVAVPEGANLLLALAAANRDENKFCDAETLNISRENAKEHLSFGFGIHYCLGAPLARLELRVVLEELTARLPQMRLAEGQTFEYLSNISFRGPLKVEVEW